MEYNLTCPVRSSENSVVHGPTQAGKTLQGPISTRVEKGVNSQSARRQEEHDQSSDDTLCAHLQYFPVLMNITDCI